MQVTADMVNGHAIGHGGLTFAARRHGVRVRVQLPRPGHRRAQRGHPVPRARSTLGDELVATAVERSREERRGVYDVEVTAGGRLVATFTGRSTQLRAEEAS